MEAAALSRMSGVPFEVIRQLQADAPAVIEALCAELRRGEPVAGLPVRIVG